MNPDEFNDAFEQWFLARELTWLDWVYLILSEILFNFYL